MIHGLSSGIHVHIHGLMYMYKCLHIYIYVRCAIVGLRRQTDRQRKQEKKMSPQKTHDITAEKLKLHNHCRESL